MRKLKELYRRIKIAWRLAHDIDLIINGSTGITEVWLKDKDRSAMGHCSYHRIA